MKHIKHTFTRVLSAALCVLLLGCVLAAAPVTVQAAPAECPIEGATGSGTSEFDPVVVTDWDQLEAAMTYDGTLFVQVGKSIKHRGRGIVNGFCNATTVSGNITLDLNGKEVQKYDQIEGGIGVDRGLKMFAVTGTLTLNDTSGGDGSLRTISYIPDTFDFCMMSEDAFGTTVIVKDGGKFIMNGGELCPGRSQEHWCASAFTVDYAYGETRKLKKGVTERYDGYGRIQNNGTALLVEGGGEAVINGGELYGRGWSKFDWEGVFQQDTYQYGGGG